MRIEVVLPRDATAVVVAAMLAAHPYEEPAYDVVELADPGTRATGTGRIGTVEETTLERVRRAASPRRCRRPPTACAWRATRTAPCGGWRCAGGRATSCSTACVGTDADVYVTSDLRHHPAREFLEQGGPALVDVAHWAAEWTWLPVVARRLARRWGIRWRPG